MTAIEVEHLLVPIHTLFNFERKMDFACPKEALAAGTSQNFKL
jgi:hypothetical protein